MSADRWRRRVTIEAKTWGIVRLRWMYCLMCILCAARTTKHPDIQLEISVWINLQGCVSRCFLIRLRSEHYINRTLQTAFFAVCNKSLIEHFVSPTLPSLGPTVVDSTSKVDSSSLELLPFRNKNLQTIGSRKTSIYINIELRFARRAASFSYLAMHMMVRALRRCCAVKNRKQSKILLISGTVRLKQILKGLCQ